MNADAARKYLAINLAMLGTELDRMKDEPARAEEHYAMAVRAQQRAADWLQQLSEAAR